MRYTVSLNENLAAYCARELDDWIHTIRHQHPFNNDQWALLTAQIKTILDKINCEHIAASPYYRFLLQQCGRFNSLLLILAYDNLDEQALVRDIEPISHIQIPRQALRLHISKTSQDYFRSAVVEKRQGKCPRYFYTEADVQHFITAYNKANALIGTRTQVSNFFKGVPKKIASDSLGFFANRTFGQKTEEFFRGDLLTWHKEWENHYTNAILAVEEGSSLTQEQYTVLQGQGTHNLFYQQPLFPVNQALELKVTYIGHASLVLNLGVFTLITDPVHYHAGTEGYVLSSMAALAYPRETAPAFQATRYPGGQMVWISHNHHDHLCQKSLQNAFSANTLFIVPVGDGDKLRNWGFSQVMEIESWNESIIVQDQTSDATLTIHALPAKHASNRGVTDLMEALYMGCIIEYKNQKSHHLTLITGDTAVLDAEHFDQLEQWIQAHGPIQFACLACGPDRPRQLMQCTHQSTADALVYQARLTVANCKTLSNDSISIEQLQNLACRSQAYHQGCYRLGLLSYMDVPTTVMRLLAVLDSYRDLMVTELLEKLQQNFSNIYYCIMDGFERQGLLELLHQYQRIEIAEDTEKRKMRVSEIVNIITSTFHVPKIGTSSNLASLTPNPGFILDYDLLIINHSAKLRFLEKLPLLENYHSDIRLIDLLTICSHHYAKISFSLIKSANFSKLLAKTDFMDACNQADIGAVNDRLDRSLHILAEIYREVQGNAVYDETIREEGNFQTLIILLANYFVKRFSPANRVMPSSTSPAIVYN